MTTKKTHSLQIRNAFGLMTIFLFVAQPVAAAGFSSITKFPDESAIAPQIIESNESSIAPRVSSNGRYVSFESSATNLVTGDTNSVADIFVEDTQLNTITRVSVDSAGNQPDGSSRNAFISDDGRYVAFESSATNLVTGDTNGVYDVFVHDMQTGSTVRAGVSSAGDQSLISGVFLTGFSRDGRYVVFSSAAANLVAGDTNSTSDIFVHDLQTGTTTRVSVDSAGTEGNSKSFGGSISADGRYVVFSSAAANLVAGDTNSTDDIFVHDLQTGTTTRVSVDSSGSPVR